MGTIHHVHWGVIGGQGHNNGVHSLGLLLGARGQRMGFVHWGIIGGQGPKGVVNWGPFMGSLLGARVQTVGSLYGVIIGAQGPNSGVPS